MKIYVYTARDSKGVTQRGTFHAEDRGDALRQIKEKGWGVVSVQEGSAKDLVTPKRVYAVNMRMMSLVVILLVLVATYFLLPAKKVTHEQINRKKPISLKERGVVGTNKIVVSKPNVQVVQKQAITPVAVAIDPQTNVSVVVAETNKVRRYSGIRLLTKDGKDVIKERPELKTQTDRFLWAIVNSKGTRTIPVSAFHVERDFAKALSEKIAIMPTDTEEDIANKQRVEELKAEIDGLTKQGVKMVDIIKTLQQESNLSAEARRQVQRDLNKLVKEGKIDEAGVFADKVNAEMKAENIEPVYVHPKLLEQGLQKEAEGAASGGVK